uniref:Aconitase AMT8 n=1 Tax=Alternaria alternata TaxID=5599 RepID=AMT8_ALTAL
MAAYLFTCSILQTLSEAGKIEIAEDKLLHYLGELPGTPNGPVQLLENICTILEGQGRATHGNVIRHVLNIVVTEQELGGLGISGKSWEEVDEHTLHEIKFLTDAWLTAAESRAAARHLPQPLKQQDTRRLPMNLAEKILAHHAFSVPRRERVVAGDLLRVSIDWVIASELSWVGMKHSVTSLDMKPSAWRNDRFWLSGDHTVDPRTYHDKRVQALIKGLESAKRDLKMTENQGSNYTIMHTEFVRERAEPGMLVLGSDSHTCSAGAVSALAIGLGAGDVMAGLATGETWFKVPECIRINFTGQPAWYIGGKDVILSVLKQLKRNTYAAERIVEFGGAGAKLLSCDARFAISNMCTVRDPNDRPELKPTADDRSTSRNLVLLQAFLFPTVSLNRLSIAAGARYEGASYASTFEIDLGEVEPFIAIYPSPDQVCPVAERTGMRFDGCFIGACTTTEEDLVLAALVLEAGLKRGLTLEKGKRIVVPGSLPIVKNLRALGLLDIYKACGYEQPAPGCSLCLGIGADVAEAGSQWLSSQNRNFQNRMGRGAVGHICSAATVAASSFNMTLTDPCDLLNDVSETTFKEYLARCKVARGGSESKLAGGKQANNVQYIEPCLLGENARSAEGEVPALEAAAVSLDDARLGSINSRIYKLDDYVDTDAIIPAPACVGSPTDEMLGSHCFELTNPDFRDYVRSGHRVIVGGRAFGCGSSREEAPRALKGLGVQCVIARSFAFIFGRNMPNIGMLAIVLTDEAFYKAAQQGENIEVDVEGRVVHVAGQTFPFSLDDMELQLIRNRGLAASYQKLGSKVFAALCQKPAPLPISALADATLAQGGSIGRQMDW